MNLKRKICSIVAIVSFIAFLLMQNVSYAEIVTGNDIKYNYGKLQKSEKCRR